MLLVVLNDCVTEAIVSGLLYADVSAFSRRGEREASSSPRASILKAGRACGGEQYCDRWRG
jgi:hypothetical protein